MVVQVALVQFRPVAVAIKMLPLTVTQFAISIGIGASCLIWGKYLKLKIAASITS
jgi:hypothetical protein